MVMYERLLLIAPKPAWGSYDPMITEINVEDETHPPNYLLGKLIFLVVGKQPFSEWFCVSAEEGKGLNCYFVFVLFPS